MIPSAFRHCGHQIDEKTNSNRRGTGICAAGVSVRDYSAEDRNAVIEVFREGILDGIDREKDDRTYDYMEGWLNSVLYKYDDVPALICARNGGRLFVARDDKNEIVGTIGIIVSDEDAEKKRGEVIRLSVRKKLRGRGIGKYLLVYLMNYAKNELKLTALHLESTINVFIAACGLYEKFGFKEFGRTCNTDGSIDILMELKLNSIECPSTINLRDYTAEDRAIAIEIFKEGIFEVVDREKYAKMYARTEAWINSILYKYDDVPAMVYAKNGGRLWIARDEKDAVVGTVGIIVTDEDLKKKQGELVRFAVRPEFRGRGIGTFLLEFVIEYAKNEVELCALHLETTLSRVDARSLYEKFRFKEIRREVWGDEEPNIGVIMQLDFEGKE